MKRDIIKNIPAIAGVASIIVKNGPSKKADWVTSGNNDFSGIRRGDDNLNIRVDC